MKFGAGGSVSDDGGEQGEGCAGDAGMGITRGSAAAAAASSSLTRFANASADEAAATERSDLSDAMAPEARHPKRALLKAFEAIAIRIIVHADKKI